MDKRDRAGGRSALPADRRPVSGGDRHRLAVGRVYLVDGRRAVLLDGGREHDIERRALGVLGDGRRWFTAGLQPRFELVGTVLYRLEFGFELL